MKIQIFSHPSPEISLSVQNHTFYADVCTPRQYRLRICNQCISMRNCGNFYRTYLVARNIYIPQRILLKIRADIATKKKKKKKSPFFSLLSPSSVLFLSLFFCLSLVRGGSLPPLPPPVGTLLPHVH